MGTKMFYIGTERNNSYGQYATYLLGKNEMR